MRVPAFVRVRAWEDRTMSVRLGVAIIGLGNAFEPHAKSLLDLLDRVDVRWAAAPSGHRLKDAASRYHFPVTTDIDRAMADPEVAAAILLSPANTHLELARRCFALGKHVLCEKPLDVSVERAERLVEAGHGAGLRLGVVLQSRFRPGSVRLRRALQAGALGRIEAASLVVPWWRPQEYYDQPGRGTRWRDGGGVLLTQAIHALDLFRSLVGVREVSAAQVATTALHRMETEDYAAALVRLGNGAPGTIMATTAAYPGSAEIIRVIGTEGSAWLSGGALRVSLLDGTREVIEDTGGSGGGASDFVDAIEEERDPAVTGEEALASQRLVEAILAKARETP
jgi:predicted dehydrogenase